MGNLQHWIRRVAAASILAVAMVGFAGGPGPHEARGAALFTVNSADDVDDGLCDATHCSLREAIAAANTSPGADAIAFDIAPGGLQTIAPNSSALGLLPAVTDTVDIDGTTEPGYAGQPIIELSGAIAGAIGIGLQFNIGSDNSTVRGFVVSNFTQYALGGAAGVSGLTFDGNFVGTNAAGTLAAGNGGGICLCGAFSSTVGGPSTAPDDASGNAHRTRHRR
jgi:CSLREA domain-containing protein